MKKNEKWKLRSMAETSLFVWMKEEEKKMKQIGSLLQVNIVERTDSEKLFCHFIHQVEPQHFLVGILSN